MPVTMVVTMETPVNFEYGPGGGPYPISIGVLMATTMATGILLSRFAGCSWDFPGLYCQIHS